MSTVRKYTEDDYKIRCSELDVQYIGSHKEQKRGTVIEFICNKHKDKGIQNIDWSHMRIQKGCCGYCNGRKRTTDDFRNMISSDIEVVGVYTKSEEPILVRCKVCGYEWSAIAKDLYNKRLQKTNSSGCPKCGEKMRIKHRTKSLDQFKKELFLVNPFIEPIGEYINTHTPIKCKCKKCGHEWDGYPANLLNKSAGCPKCHLSEGERRLINCLESLGINYSTQFSFPDLKNSKSLRFDAYDINNNIAFEFNGEQHYFPVDFGKRGKEYAEEEYKLNLYRDNLKKEYCVENNIKLIVIPYWDISNLEKIVKEQYQMIA